MRTILQFVDGQVLLDDKFQENGMWIEDIRGNILFRNKVVSRGILIF